MEVALGGLVLGLLQGFGGVEHLACIMPSLSTNQLMNATVGLVWGISHAVGVLSLTALAFYLKQSTGFHIASKVADSFFGITLVVVGVLSMYRHTHHSSCCSSKNEPVNEQLQLLEAPLSPKKVESYPLTLASSTGFLHGLSGCSCAVALLPVLALPGWKLLGTYAAAFLVGVSFGSAGFALIVSYAFKHLTNFHAFSSWVCILTGSGWIAHVLLSH